MLAMASRNHVAIGPSRRRPLGRLGLPLCVCLAWGAAACSSEPPPPKREAKLPHQTAESIPDVPVTGTIGKVPFTVQEARYSIDRRRGYEKLDIMLLGTKSETPCGKIPSDAPAIWMRHKGAAAPAAGETRLTPDGKSEWAVHYQVRDGHRWTGSGDAAALLVVRPATGGLYIEGDLAVCFSDPWGSCASGTFKAQHCPVSIDLPVRGTDNLERLPADAGAPSPDGSTP